MIARNITSSTRTAIVSPSWVVTKANKEHFLKGLAFLQSISDVKEYDKTFVDGEKSYPKAYRIKTFNEALCMDAVFCSSGGWGAKELLNDIDYVDFKEHKPLIFGFSDHSYLLNAISLNTGLITFHGSDVSFGLGRFLNEEVKKEFCAILCSTQRKGFELQASEIKAEGKAKGKLFGGNTECVVDMARDGSFKLKEDSILFLESLLLSKEELKENLAFIFEQEWATHITAVILGNFNKISSDDVADTALSIIKEMPVVVVDWIGHTEKYKIIPIGLLAELDTENQEIRFLEDYLDS